MIGTADVAAHAGRLCCLCAAPLRPLHQVLADLRGIAQDAGAAVAAHAGTRGLPLARRVAAKERALLACESVAKRCARLGVLGLEAAGRCRACATVRDAQQDGGGAGG